MFELAALGLLQQEPLHGYRLKQKLEMFMSGCISVNYGTIYPLLKRLEQQGAITVTCDQASTRKIYSLTEKGRILWREKMMEHPHESWVNARSRFMIKFFFFSYLEPAQRIHLLEYRLKICHLKLNQEEMQSTPKDPYEAALWEHFAVVLHNEIAWLKQILQDELR